MLYLFQSRLRSAQFAHWSTSFVKTAVSFREQENKTGEKEEGGCFPVLIAKVQGSHWKSPLTVTSLSVLLLYSTGGMHCLQSEIQSETTDTGWVCWFPQPVQQKTCSYFSFARCQPEKGSGGARVEGRRGGRKWHQCHLQQNWRMWSPLHLYPFTWASCFQWELNLKKVKQRTILFDWWTINCGYFTPTITESAF